MKLWQRLLLDLLILLLCLLVLWNAGGSFIVRGNEKDKMPPIPEMVIGVDCQLQQQKNGWWVTIGTVTYFNHDQFQHDPWSVKLGQSTDDMKAHKLCNRWREQVLKVRQEVQKRKAKENTQ